MHDVDPSVSTAENKKNRNHGNIQADRKRVKFCGKLAECPLNGNY
jgi:hypothetical protein